jgi:RNA polymerase sigma-70 factor, ECF subfamily
MIKKESKNKNEEVESLVILAQDGDTDAFSKIYDVFVDQIYKYIFYRVKNEDAEDLVENVFLKVWENIRQYKPKQKSFSAWVFRIAHNLVIDYYRATRDKDLEILDETLPDHTREHNPIRVVEGKLDNQFLKIALFKLKKQYQEIIVYKFINEFSNTEIAELIGKSEGSLRILQFRALKALKKELNEMGVSY